MTSPRYETTGLPPEAAAGHTAFLPHFNRLAGSGAQQYKDRVYGWPGTKMIPLTARRDSVPSPDLGDIAQMGLGRSTDAPDAFWPNLYYAYPEREYYPGAGMPVQIYDPVRPEYTTMIPVPAVSLRTVHLRTSAKLAMGVTGVAGRKKGTRDPAGRLIQRWTQRLRGNGLPDG